MFKRLNMCLAVYSVFVLLSACDSETKQESKVVDVPEEVSSESDEMKEGRKEVSKAIGEMAEALLKLHEIEKEHEEIKRNAELGDRISQFKLGRLYGNGSLKEINMELAFEWIKKSAENGYVLAQYELGVCYSNGLGTDKNSEEAFKWYCPGSA